MKSGLSEVWSSGYHGRLSLYMETIIIMIIIKQILVKVFRDLASRESEVGCYLMLSDVVLMLSDMLSECYLGLCDKSNTNCKY